MWKGLSAPITATEMSIASDNQDGLGGSLLSNAELQGLLSVHGGGSTFDVSGKRVLIPGVGISLPTIQLNNINVFPRGEKEKMDGVSRQSVKLDGNLREG